MMKAIQKQQTQSLAATLALGLFILLALVAKMRGDEPRTIALLNPRAKIAEVVGGSLEVYSASDGFDDGGVFYYAHSAYDIYGSDGRLFKAVQNHTSRSDENPETVALPAGNYTIVARSETKGFVTIRVVIQRGQRTVLR